jgi:probable addiction module antidote protein
MSTIKKKRAGLRSFGHYLTEELKDPKFAVEYLRASLRDGDKEDFAQAVRDVVKARGNVSSFALSAGVTRKTVHKMLSGKGDLTFNSLSQILSAIGGRFDVALDPQPQHHVAA